jgi:hypothetical protein
MMTITPEGRAVSTVIILMTEAVNTSGMSLNYYQTTRRNIPQGSHI